jgi:DNA segregation ATPase FtsK/SpoIIIE-like protein
MKLIKVKDQYYNLNHYQQFSINDGIFMLSSSLIGSLSKSNNRIFDDNNDINDIDLDSELIFRIIHSTNQMEFMKQFDQFLNGTSNLMDYSSLIEIDTDYLAKLHAFKIRQYIPDGSDSGADLDMNEIDAMFVDSARIVVINQQGSASLLQRKLKLGYNRAGRIVDQLEGMGIISPFQGGKAREVLFSDIESLDELLRTRGLI